MMVTGPISTSKKSDNKTIYEILLKIRDKWSVGHQSLKDTSPDTPPQILVDDNKKDDDFSDEEIVTETVLLRPEDFLADSPGQTVQDNTAINKPGYIGPQMTREDSARETIEQVEEDLPKTVIQDLELLKTEGPPSSDSPEMKIPETVIFSTQGTTGTSLPSDRATSAKCGPDRQKQATSIPVMGSDNSKGPSDEADLNDTVPETIIFRGKIDHDE